MRSRYTFTIPSVNKKPGEETTTRLRRTRLAEKVIMVIFWDKYGILLRKYPPGGTTISSFYYASIIQRLCCAILDKRRSKVNDGVLLLDDNVPVHKCNIVLAALRKAGFIDLNYPTYSPDTASSDYYLFSNFNKFLRGKNFSRDDEIIGAVEDYLNNVD